MVCETKDPSREAVFRSLSAFRAGPGNILVRVFDFTGFAMQTVGGVQLQTTFLSYFIRFNFINVTRTEPCARRPVPLQAFGNAQMRVVNDEVTGFIFPVLRFG
jgi:hypothetical protein